MKALNISISTVQNSSFSVVSKLHEVLWEISLSSSNWGNTLFFWLPHNSTIGLENQGHHVAHHHSRAHRLQFSAYEWPPLELSIAKPRRIYLRTQQTIQISITPFCLPGWVCPAGRVWGHLETIWIPSSYYPGDTCCHTPLTKLGVLGYDLGWN